MTPNQTWDPWYYATTEEYRHYLEAQGFKVSYIALIPRPTPLPGDILGWLETFAQSFTAALPAPERPTYLNEVKEALRRCRTMDRGLCSPAIRCEKAHPIINSRNCD